MGDLSANFSRNEFQCKGGDCDIDGGGNCGFNTVDVELVKLLENIRAHFGKPVHINSGCRCSVHNDRVGGSRKSQHTLGRAADIFIMTVPPSDVARYVDSKWPKRFGVGVYSTFTHIDSRSNGPARWG